MTTSEQFIDQALRDLRADAEHPVSVLTVLVDALRPRRVSNIAAANQALDVLTQRLAADSDTRDTLRAVVIGLLSNRKAVHLLTDSGVLASEGFFSGLSSRLSRKLLPAEIDPERLKIC